MTMVVLMAAIFGLFGVTAFRLLVLHTGASGQDGIEDRPEEAASLADDRPKFPYFG